MAKEKHQVNKNYIECVDHLGRIFPSEKEMCRYWQIGYETYRGRLERGWTIEKALTTPTSIKKKRTFIIDGVKYDNVSELCRAYNIERISFITHIKNGLSAKEAVELTLKNKKARKHYKKPRTCWYDHLGIKYSSLTEMAKAYNIRSNLLRSRINKGMSIEEALTTPPRRTFAKMEEHIGETVRNKQGHLATCVAVKRTDKQTNIIVRFEDGLKKMCRYDSFKKGEVLHPLDNKAHKCIDHLGQEYSSERAMCKAYNVHFTTFRGRIKNGCSIKDALTLPPNHRLIVKDYLGNEYPNVSAMCKAYNISATTFRGRIKNGWALEKALTTPSKHIKTDFISATYIKTFNGKHYYKCQCKKCNWEHKKILTMQEVLQHEKECS